jgi:hypothetical protein
MSTVIRKLPNHGNSYHGTVQDFCSIDYKCAYEKKEELLASQEATLVPYHIIGFQSLFQKTPLSQEMHLKILRLSGGLNMPNLELGHRTFHLQFLTYL